MTVPYTPKPDPQDPRSPRQRTPGGDAAQSARGPELSGGPNGGQNTPFRDVAATPTVAVTAINRHSEIDRLPTSALRTIHDTPESSPALTRPDTEVKPIPEDPSEQETKTYHTPSRIVRRVGGARTPLASEPMTDPRRKVQQVEIEDGNLILHRTQNFFLRTVHTPGRRGNPLRKPTGHTTAMPKVMPDQGNRIAASETHMMPSVTPINPVKPKAFPVPSWLEAIVVFVGLAISLVAHTFNMFNFPRYELDEGTYMSSAWAITQGLITPYAYGYGHPPLAWMQIAAWVQLTGGFFTFGNANNSGRVLMLLYAVGCSLLIYLIIRRFGGSRSAGLLAMIIFSLSPLSVTYQRQVLLDNVGTFWLLLSIYLLVVGNSRLLYIILASVCFGIAFLSKEIFALFLPVMIYTVWLHTTKFQRKFALVAFIYIFMALCSSWVLMAILKGELLPYEWHLPWDTHPHLSMLDTFISQTQRSQSEGSLASSWQAWTEGDQVLIGFSIFATLFNLVIGWWKRKQLLLALFAISFWLLLVRGGVVFPFYVIPLIPLTALNAAMAINTVMDWIGRLVRFDIVRAILIFGVIAAIIPYDLQNSTNAFTQHPTSAQNEALDWVRAHVPHNSMIVINSYLYTDLKVPGGAGVGNGATYPHAEVYDNVATDPELYGTLLDYNYDRIDYIIADSEMLQTISTNFDHMYLIQDALKHSVLLETFQADDHDQKLVIWVYQVIHKNPPPVV